MRSAKVRWPLVLAAAVPATLVVAAIASAGSSGTGQAPARPYRLQVPLVVREGLSPVAQDGFVTSATAEPSSGEVRISANVTAKQAASVLVQVEVYNANGERVHVHGEDNISFSAGGRRAFTTTWRTAGIAAGSYTVRVGIFGSGAGWETLYHWNNAAASFTLP